MAARRTQGTSTGKGWRARQLATGSGEPRARTRAATVLPGFAWEWRQHANHTSSRIYTPWRIFPSSPESCFLLLQVSPLPLEHYRSGELGSFRMSSNVCVCCCPSSVPRLQMWATCWCFQDWPIPWIACSCICYLCPVEIFTYLPCYVPVAFLAPHLPFSGSTET